MSLVLAAIRGRRAIVSTDGATSRAFPDGHTERILSDCPKFHPLSDGLVIASTSTHGWLSNIAREKASEFIAAGGTSIAHLVAFLAAELPVWQRQLEQIIAREGAVVHNGEIGGAFALCGFRPGWARARLVVFSQGRGYVPFEAVCVAFSPTAACSASAQTMLKAALESKPWEKMPAELRRIAHHVARTEPRVGGNYYTFQIDPAPVGAPRAAPVYAEYRPGESAPTTRFHATGGP